jgi:hypothetical protein
MEAWNVARPLKPTFQLCHIIGAQRLISWERIAVSGASRCLPNIMRRVRVVEMIKISGEFVKKLRKPLNERKIQIFDPILVWKKLLKRIKVLKNLPIQPQRIQIECEFEKRVEQRNFTSSFVYHSEVQFEHHRQMHSKNFHLEIHCKSWNIQQLLWSW